MNSFTMPTYSVGRSTHDVFPNEKIVEKISSDMDKALKNKVESDIKSIEVPPKENDQD